MILMLVEMGSIIENSLFPFMVGSLITSVTSMAGRVSSYFTSEHNNSLRIPKESVCHAIKFSLSPNANLVYSSCLL